MESGERCCLTSVSTTAAGYTAPDLLYCPWLWWAASRVMLRAATSFRGEMGRWRRPQRHHDCERCCMTFPGCEPTWQHHVTFSVFLFGSLSLCLLFFVSAGLSVAHFPFVSLPSRAAPSRVPFVLQFLDPLFSLSFVPSTVIFSSPVHARIACSRRCVTAAEECLLTTTHCS